MSTREFPPPPKILSPSGVVVPPGLQISEMTLREHLNLFGYDQNQLTRADAVKAGYSDDEIAHEYGTKI